MVFCTECGKSIADGAKFCANCGAAINGVPYSNEVHRQHEYSGKIIKCPNCGEVLKSFEAICPACGYEIRAAGATNSVREFAQKIESVTTEQAIIDLVRTFPIPNTKEDIFEFMILASTNLVDEPRKGLFDAWISKFEQSYQKAQLVFENDTNFDKIQSIYEQTDKQIKKERLSHGTKAVGEALSKAASFSPNPVFTVVASLVIIYTIILIFSGNFSGAAIIIDALILWGAYRITNGKKQNKEQRSAQEDEPETIMIKYPHGNYENAYLLQAKLEQAGFVNIRMLNLKDIKVGFLKKPGEIESVSINGKDSRPIKKLYPNAPIIITYHGRPNDQ